MQGLVESVKAAGVNQPALVHPREDGGYEIIAGHRRQRASELAGFANMPCIVRNMTDDEAILAMTDDNLRHRERILPTEKAQSLKMQVEAIKHQGSRPGEEDKDAGKTLHAGRGRSQRHELQAGAAVYPPDRACAGFAEDGGREKAGVHPGGGDLIHSPQESEVYRRVHRGAAVLALAVAGIRKCGSWTRTANSTATVIDGNSVTGGKRR